MDLSPFKILTHIVNVLILYFFLRKILYKPVMNFLKNRENQFQQRVDAQREREQEAEALKKEYVEKIEQAKEEANHIIEQANQLAEERSAEIIRMAKTQSQDILERARREIESERKQVQDSLKTETAVMAVEIASKIIAREISLEDNQKVIDDFLQKVV